MSGTSLGSRWLSAGQVGHRVESSRARRRADASDHRSSGVEAITDLVADCGRRFLQMQLLRRADARHRSAVRVHLACAAALRAMRPQLRDVRGELLRALLALLRSALRRRALAARSL